MRPGPVHGGFREQEERGLSWSLGWTMSFERDISSKGMVPAGLAAPECHNPGITGHLRKVNCVSWSYVCFFGTPMIPKDKAAGASWRLDALRTISVTIVQA